MDEKILKPELYHWVFSAEMPVPTNLPTLLLQPKDLSWQGTFSLGLCLKIAEASHANSQKIIFKLDAPLHPKNLSAFDDFFELIAGFGCSLQVQDLGLAKRLTTNHPHQSFWVILGNQGKNFSAWATLAEKFGSQLAGLVLSPELPFFQVCSLAEKAQGLFPNLLLEILAVGRVPIFYSPRPLLNPLGYYHYNSQEKNARLQGIALSNRLGTVLYYERDLFILEELLDLTLLPNIRLRIELDPDSAYLTRTGFKPGWEKTWKKAWPRPTTKGFFRSNRTDAPLKLLKNPLHSTAARNLGQVIEYVPNSHTLIQLNEPFQLPLAVEIHTPDQKNLPVTLEELSSFPAGEKILKGLPGLYEFAPIPSAISGSLLFHSPLGPEK